MIIQLQDKIAKYITRNAPLSDWRDIREHYARYSYLAFMCLIAESISPDFEVKSIGDILCDNRLEDRDVVNYVLSTGDAVNFICEVMNLVREQEIRDINEIYQGFLAGDFVLKDKVVSFDGSKNNRDILGSYYTQESFAFEITKKAIEDYFKENSNVNVRIADYSCGGGAFLVSACKVCLENEIVPRKDMDVVVGNPPWEKIRFEEKKFLHHFAQGADIGTKAERDLFLQGSSQANKEYYFNFLDDYESAKAAIRKDPCFDMSSCGELNTYALFTELCLNSLGETGRAGIIVKTSLVKMPVYSRFLDN